MKKKIVAAVLLSALVFSAGCGKQSESDSESMSDQPAVSEESAEPEQAEIVQNQNVSQISEIKKPIVTFEKVENNVMSEDGQVTLVYASFMQPTFYLNDNDVVQKLETAFQEIELGYERVLSESAEEVGWQYEENGDEIVSYEVAYDFSLQRGDDRVLSFIQESYGYMAGVHGYTEETGLNFDMKTGEALSLNDIAADKEALLDSAKSYIAELLELPRFEEALYGSKEDAMKVVEEDVLSDDNYWYFTNTGITFVANAYILGPYAAGSFHFDIPYEKLNGLKEEYKYQGPYEMGLPIGAAGTADLDGDGQQDMISYQCTIDEATSEPIPVLVINDTDFSDALKDENAFLTEGANEYSADKYYIVDLDVSDKYLELAIRDSGPSDDPVTFFLRYDGQKLAYLGCIGDFVGKSTTILNGDGTIQADVHSGEPGTKAETVLYQWDEENGIQALK